MITDNFLACNFHYKSTDKNSVVLRLITHYLDQLAELYSLREEDANNTFLRTENGREYFVAYAADKGLTMEYYEFTEKDYNDHESVIAYGFRVKNNEALTRELLEVQS